MLNSAKKQYYRDNFDKNKHNLRKSWSIIGEIINKKKSNSSLPNKFAIDGKEVDDSNVITNKFNKYFTSIGRNLAKKIPDTAQSHKTYLSGEYNSTFLFTSTTETEILKIITDLKDSACGWDFISPTALRHVKTCLITPITFLCNMSMKYGVVPTELKLAKVIPIFISGDKQYFSNYRIVYYKNELK